MKTRFISFWLRAVYALNLRWPFIRVQRWLVREHRSPRRKLHQLSSPEAVQGYMMSLFQYRLDEMDLCRGKIKIPLDWVSDPEVFQYRLESKEIADGDCDDVHFWAATMLKKVPEVTKVYLLSSGFYGGAHTTAVFQRHDGSWWHFDYYIYRLDDPNEAPLRVAERYTKRGDPVEVTFYVFETIDPPWKAVAISPAKLRVT